MLKVDGLTVDIGAIPILREASLDLNNGEIVGLIGRNGAGKTTFLRALMGLLDAKAGHMAFDDVELTAVPAQRRAHLGIGYMPEDRKLVPSLTAEENIQTPVWSMNIADWESRLGWIYKIMPEAEQFRDRPSNSLSGGQQKLVALARALMVGHKLLLLDEPSEGIAPALAQRMGAILKDLKAEGVSILVAESNVHHVSDLIDRMFVIERGAVAEQAMS